MKFQIVFGCFLPSANWKIQSRASKNSDLPKMVTNNNNNNNNKILRQSRAQGKDQHTVKFNFTSLVLFQQPIPRTSVQLSGCSNPFLIYPHIYSEKSQQFISFGPLKRCFIATQGSSCTLKPLMSQINLLCLVNFFLLKAAMVFGWLV